MAPPRPTSEDWYLLSRTITRCTSASGTRFSWARAAISSSYLECVACAEAGSGEAATAATTAARQDGRSRRFIDDASGGRTMAWGERGTRGNPFYTVIGPRAVTDVANLRPSR